MNIALKKENLNVRITPDEMNLIRRAAAARGKSVSAFVIEAASTQAEKTLLDQRLFVLDAEAFDEIADLLSQPPKVHPELQKLFKMKPKWATSKS